MRDIGYGGGWYEGWLVAEAVVENNSGYEGHREEYPVELGH